MGDLINIVNQDGELVVSSREVAKNFDKRHNDVVLAIENKIDNLTTENIVVENYFLKSIFMHRGNTYDEYLLTRDGFSFLVMGFTGVKADIWKVKYIEAFNQMEEKIKNNQLNTEGLSPQLQLLINMELKQKELEATVNETKEELQDIREVITINPKAEWRVETNKILNAIGKKLDNYSTARNEVYEALKVRANCRPNVLINNLKKRALENGMTPSKADKLNILDVLENDARLREIYIAIVKEMAIRHKVTFKEAI